MMDNRPCGDGDGVNGDGEHGPSCAAMMDNRP
jgi:hypothetical protein